MDSPAPFKISFCTTCSNRSHQLKQTFDANAAIVERTPNVEWIIVNFNSKDDLHEYMLGKLPQVSKRIVYAKDSSGRPWHASYAKNIAHRLGKGEFLMNLDCDNFIGNAVQLIRLYSFEGYKLLYLSSGTMGDGTAGRVAIARELFHALGGYDETFYPMGYQDIDLVQRARAAKTPSKRCFSSSDLAIKNSKIESIMHCAQAGLAWEDYNRANYARSTANIAAGKLVANVGTWKKLQLESFTGD